MLIFKVKSNTMTGDTSQILFQFLKNLLEIIFYLYFYLFINDLKLYDNEL